MRQLFKSQLEKFSLTFSNSKWRPRVAAAMEVNEETLAENDSSIPLKEQERNGRNAGNAYIEENIFKTWFIRPEVNIYCACHSVTVSL